MSLPIALLTDFGLDDSYQGVVKGVILERNPAATVVDLCQRVPPQDVRRGAFLLATSVAYFPLGTVFLVVVDPGVGTNRRALALESAGRFLVGPDNGIFSWALRFLERDGLLTLRTVDGQLELVSGARAVELTERRFWRPSVSSTFHGRDLFGPVAAELSLGRPLEELGTATTALVDLAWPEPVRLARGSCRAEVVSVDGFGNLITSLRPEHLPERPRFEIAGRTIDGLAAHFQSGEQLIALMGSSGLIELAVPNGSAADLLQASSGTPVEVSPTSVG